MTEHWTDEMLDQLASKVDAITDNVGALAGLGAQQLANSDLQRIQMMSNKSVNHKRATSNYSLAARRYQYSAATRYRKKLRATAQDK